MKKIDVSLNNFKSINSNIKNIELEGTKTLNVIKSSDITAFDEATFARLNEIEFQNGIIEVKVYSKLLPDAPTFARGFIGVVFRVNKDNSQFESIYVRPTNGRTTDAVRKNHAVQYFSYPDYKFDKLRETEPEIYEAAADIGLEEWIQLKIEVKNSEASLYINNSPRPVLVVNTLKYGTSKGGIGLWCDIGTDAYFKDLVITKTQD
ncbi:hypothetical protein ERUR111494_09160 [Erysipelothrix urinaevulpis]|uniref:hypothetical protein n=1 Tax=Erysipelothrix urinaevulpis TaxID=2683717 RepID=UPI001357C578|nr:hypothetical protein [Erysipelothrix urinaevulpis]